MNSLNILTPSPPTHAHTHTQTQSNRVSTFVKFNKNSQPITYRTTILDSENRSVIYRIDDRSDGQKRSGRSGVYTLGRGDLRDITPIHFLITTSGKVFIEQID